MATLSKAINKNLFDSILPSFGNPRVHMPVWDDSQKMFNRRTGEGWTVPQLDIHRQHRTLCLQRAEDGTHPEA